MSAQWTWLVYMAGDNNLQGAGNDDLAEMKKVGSTADVNVIVQFDTEQNTTTRYLVEKNKLKTLQTMAGVDCGDRYPFGKTIPQSKIFRRSITLSMFGTTAAAGRICRPILITIRFAQRNRGPVRG